MAMRKVFYGPEGIMLKHVLRMYDKESHLFRRLKKWMMPCVFMKAIMLF